MFLFPNKSDLVSEHQIEPSEGRKVACDVDTLEKVIKNPKLPSTKLTLKSNTAFSSLCFCNEYVTIDFVV
jgi:hypothetical protein